MKYAFAPRPQFAQATYGVALGVLVGVLSVSQSHAEQIQILRRAPASTEGLVAFTNFQREEQAITQNLPCKWISKDGRLGPSYGNARYDFLCKGGDFATISLYLDKSQQSGVGKVRLLYRDWPANTNPNAGEAETAMKFLQHVVGRFVPASIAGGVSDAFWSQKSQTFSQPGIDIKFTLEKGSKFNVRRLEITGTDRELSPQAVPLIPVDGGLTRITPAPQVPSQVFIYGKDGEPVPAPERILPGVAVTTPMPAATLPAPTTVTVVTPSDAGLAKPVETPAQINILPAVPGNIVPQPAQLAPSNYRDTTAAEPEVDTPLPTLPQSGNKIPNPEGQGLTIPANAPAGPLQLAPAPKAPETVPAQPLQEATPAELYTAPAPESKEVPAAPPEPSAKLVPNTQDITSGGTTGRAPSNFDAYNRAMELTKDVETRAQVSRVEVAKVTASKPAEEIKSQTTVPALKPAAQTPAPAPAAVPTKAQGEGLGTQQMPTQASILEDMGQPQNYQGPSNATARPLPQLKFVPKAEPLQSPDQVIQFEDERSKL
ncbi:MAG: hypothetical protein DI585_04560 [Pseudomonas fluorescens]|nr:MAG: hypothetical protein DI585_04560 [Pseudomonas fluorescens]